MYLASSSCPLYPSTFLDSPLSKLSALRFQFLRLNPPKTLPNLPTHSTTIRSSSSSSSAHTNHFPRPNPNSAPESRNRGLSTANWIDRWTTQSRPHTLPTRPPDPVDLCGPDASTDDDDSGGTQSSTMDLIVEKLKKFGYVDEVDDKKDRLPARGSVEDIFYVEEGMLPDPRGGFSEENKEGLFPWEKRRAGAEEEEERRSRSRSKTALAELTLPEGELRRLRHLAVRLKSKTKIGGGGLTKAVVDAIHEKWKTAEVVKLKCVGPPALNMKRMHEILERKTGGLVIWRSGTSVSLYRGVGYDLHSVEMGKKSIQYAVEKGPNSFSKISGEVVRDSIQKSSRSHEEDMQPIHENLADTVEGDEVPKSKPEIKYETEIDELLDTLGSRYTDWPGDGPLPVDADLLPGVVPGFKPPFRVLPYGVRSALGNKEATSLRRLARVLPPHFAIGRSRQHQGLAMAIIKLWEKSSIAIIALKRGVQLTASEIMAEDIKKLTGGTLVTRNKNFILFYRGKDFLSRDVTEALLERERLAKALQDEEEQARLRVSATVTSDFEAVEQPCITGTLGETLEADSRWGKQLDDEDRIRMQRAAEAARHAKLVRKLELKLHLAERKLMKAEKALEKVEAFLKPSGRSADPESITDEERYMIRKLGLKMKAFLLLGRRGVFDGTIENMHLHWKYRELVKIIVKAKTFAQVRNIALSLEAESGGVLVSVDKVSKGYAVIVYRGKDYQRPQSLRPKNLLTKRKALARSIELQRHEALSRHISAVRKRVDNIRCELGQMESVKDQGDEKLYDQLEFAYPSDEEETEAEGDEAYLQTYYSSEDIEDDKSDGSYADVSGDEDEQNGSFGRSYSEAKFPYDQFPI